MKAQKPKEQPSIKAATKTTASSKRQMRQKASSPLNQEQTNQPEKGHHQDASDDISEFMKGTIIAYGEQLIRQTQKVIKVCKTLNVCFYPGRQRPPYEAGITDFSHYIPYLGDCDVLIFCDPHHNEASAQEAIAHYTAGGNATLKASLDGCPGVNEKWFPTQDKDLLIWHPERNAEPQLNKPPYNRFWAHYAILSIRGRNADLHLLHLGLRGDHAWLYFLQPNKIPVARLISSPHYP